MYPMSGAPAPMQQSNRGDRQSRQSTATMHSTHRLTEEISKCSIYEKVTANPLNKDYKKYDLSLMGSAPPIEDFQLPMSTPKVLPSVK